MSRVGLAREERARDYLDNEKYSRGERNDDCALAGDLIGELYW